MMLFEWDRAKERQNIQKHGVSFEQAKQMWDDIYLEIEALARSDEGEKRSATLGRIGAKVYIAIWTKRRRKIRLISVRRARANEEKIFHQKIQNKR